jgi:hypothetical protein
VPQDPTRTYLTREVHGLTRHDATPLLAAGVAAVAAVVAAVAAVVAAAPLRRCPAAAVVPTAVAAVQAVQAAVQVAVLRVLASPTPPIQTNLSVQAVQAAEAQQVVALLLELAAAVALQVEAAAAPPLLLAWQRAWPTQQAQPLPARERRAAEEELGHRLGPVVHGKEDLHARQRLPERALVCDGVVGRVHTARTLSSSPPRDSSFFSAHRGVALVFSGCASPMADVAAKQPHIENGPSRKLEKRKMGPLEKTDPLESGETKNGPSRLREGRFERGLSRMPRVDPCVLCGGADDEGVLLLCTGTCDKPFHAHCVGFRGPVLGDWSCTGCRPRGLAKRRRRRARALRALLGAHALAAPRTTPAEPRHAPCD